MSRFIGLSAACAFSARCAAGFLAPAGFLALAGSNPARAQDLGPMVELHAGEAAAFGVTIAGADALTGPARLSRAGGARPKDGEIVVSVAPPRLSPYAIMTVTETTTRPVDFYATGFIDRIKIDDIRLCGRLDAPVTARIAAGARRIALNHFAPRKEGETCR
jgi:hypothetical protein